jgi:cell division GTPase FtsZ
MKLLVIGVGDCGSRVAGFFSELNKKAKNERRAQIVTTAYAVNNDREKLESLARTEFRDLQTIFVNRSFEVGNESAIAGAEILKIEGGRVLTVINPGDFYDTDAIFLITATAGCFGSGGVPVLVQQLKDRHIGKPIYVLAILPFESENSQENTIYNTAICLKSLQKIADAVFLVSNEKLRHLGSPVIDQENKGLPHINTEITTAFYDILCASETLDPKMVGARSLGIGDVLQTLTGWTAIGTGRADFPLSRNLWKTMPDFQEKGSDTQKTMEAMNLALANLSIDFKLEDTYKALYLLSIPYQGANLDMVKVVGNRLMEITNNALIRGGDFYGARDHAQVTLVFSDLTFVETVKNYYDKAVNIAKA